MKSEGFGHKWLSEFSLDPGVLNVNFGSFGSALRRVLEVQKGFQEQMNGNPDRWFRIEMPGHVMRARERVAEFVNADCGDVVIVENASDAANAVLKSLFAGEGGGSVLSLDIAYPMVKNTLGFLEERFGVEVVSIETTEEMLNSDIECLSAVEKAIMKHPKPIAAAVIDHISSVPSSIFPVKELCALLRKHNVISIVDGAHAIGQVSIDIKNMNPDFYFSNLHKWAFVPKNAAFLYIAKPFQSSVHPNIISNKHWDPFPEEFSYTGTRDISAVCCIPEALRLINEIHGDRIMEYNRALAWEGQRIVSEEWGTEALVTNRDRLGAMFNVRIPCGDRNLVAKASERTMREKNCFVAFGELRGKMYARFSAQIFNEAGDFRSAARMYLAALEEEVQRDFLRNLEVKKK